MFDLLKERWSIYQTVLAEEAARPHGEYNGDRVQAHGLAFACVFQSLKDEICQAIDFEPDKFDYGAKLVIMNKIIAL